MDDKIVDAQVFLHPHQNGDGEWIYIVEFLDENGDTVKSEYFKSKAAAHIAMRAAVEKNLPSCR